MRHTCAVMGGWDVAERLGRSLLSGGRRGLLGRLSDVRRLSSVRLRDAVQRDGGAAVRGPALRTSTSCASCTAGCAEAAGRGQSCAKRESLEVHMCAEVGGGSQICAIVGCM